jgi:hypothetical protein
VSYYTHFEDSSGWNVLIDSFNLPVTRIDQNLSDELLQFDFSLLQNFPNPFNNSTVISYSILQEGLATLKVYNLLGEEVAEIVNDTKQTGNYEVSFDATGLPSGIYFYRLRAGDFIKTKKMILLK